MTALPLMSRPANLTYTNPVFVRSFPDPFVLKFRGEYFAYCTGFAPDGRVFGVLRSTDLVNWTELAGAMQPLATDAPFYWAPEVSYFNGKFYLYYSVGNETLMEIRIAIADRPDGNFIDAGRRLTFQEFAIDPHVFRDDDGCLYMFYATDFLTEPHIGTGTVVDRMLDPLTLEGKPRTVTRAKYDWQVYDPARKEKGGVRWHTVEGPCVLKRKGAYFEMFSGGNWKNISYGVGYAVTRDLFRNVEWRQICDGTDSLPLLRTIPEKVVGPGHNSAVEGPNGRELYCVYHRWVGDHRVMAIDRMDFAGGERLFVVGPTTTEQPAPFRPALLDTFESLLDTAARRTSGEWRLGKRAIISHPDRTSEIVYETGNASFFCKFYVRSIDGCGEFGVRLGSVDGQAAEFLISPTESEVVWRNGKRAGPFKLQPNFNAAVWHEVTLEVDGHYAKLSMDDADISVTPTLESEIAHVTLFANGGEAAFSAFSLTSGFEDIFATNALQARGWRIEGNGSVEIENECLVIQATSPVQLSKNMIYRDADVAVNLLLRSWSETSRITVKCGGPITIRKAEDWMLDASGKTFPLPPDYSPEVFHQFRFLHRGDRLTIYVDDVICGDTNFTGNASNLLSIEIEDAAVVVDMIRFTAI